MKKIKYSKLDLDGFSLKELQRICRYYGIEYRPSWSKAKLKQEILDYSPVELIEKTYNMGKIQEVMIGDVPVMVKTEPAKSIRIQRIEDRKEK